MEAWWVQVQQRCLGPGRPLLPCGMSGREAAHCLFAALASLAGVTAPGHWVPAFVRGQRPLWSACIRKPTPQLPPAVLPPVNPGGASVQVRERALPARLGPGLPTSSAHGLCSPALLPTRWRDPAVPAVWVSSELRAPKASGPRWGRRAPGQEGAHTAVCRTLNAVSRAQCPARGTAPGGEGRMEVVQKQAVGGPLRPGRGRRGALGVDRTGVN